MKILPSTKIFIAKSAIENAGRGVFATNDIEKNEIIEKCPIILVKEAEVTNLRKTELHNYYFMWGNDKKYHKAAICLGFGSLYNHSYSPNATYKKLLEDNLIEFVAMRNIPKGEEITVNYNYGNPDDMTRLWIEDIPPAL